MRRALGLVSVIVVSLFVGGCTVPMSVTAAGWAIDGISYIATNKSLTDHGLSFAAGMDCALYRVVVSGKICHEYGDSETLLADAGERFNLEEEALPEELSDNDSEEPSVLELANFETASGGDEEEEVEAEVGPEEEESELSSFSPRSLVRSGISFVELVVGKATFWR